MFATLQRLKWFPAEYDTWMTDTGEVVNLTKVIPHRVTALIRQAVDRRLWEACSIKDTDPSKDHRDIPNTKIARSVILGKDKIIGAMARSVTINT